MTSEQEQTKEAEIVEQSQRKDRTWQRFTMWMYGLQTLLIFLLCMTCNRRFPQDIYDVIGKGFAMGDYVFVALLILEIMKVTFVLLICSPVVLIFGVLSRHIRIEEWVFDTVYQPHNIVFMNIVGLLLSFFFVYYLAERFACCKRILMYFE
jgi:hypothetical protein